MSYGSFANSAQTVIMNSYDNYTNSDGILNDYASVYRRKNHKYYVGGAEIATSDDPIINLIPRNLFITRGTYSYIGLEYGFYIKTYQDYGNDNISEFILFDITRTELYPERLSNDAPIIKINPVYSGSAMYDYSRKVIHEPFSIDTYLALANINVKVGLRNYDQLNIDDSGYNKYNDYGNFFSSSSVTAKGEGIKRDKTNVDLSLLKIAVAGVKFLIPGPVGTIVSMIGRPILTATESYFNGYYASNRVSYHNLEKLSDGRYFGNQTTLGNNNANSVINNYGNLPKDLTAVLVNNSHNTNTNYPLLYKNNTDYFQVSYSLAQKDSSINWNTLVSTEISLDIYRDDTGWFLWWTTGSLSHMDSVYGGKIEYFNESPSHSNGGNIIEGSVMRALFKNGNGVAYNHSHNPVLGSYQDFYFTPNRTFSYVIETFNRVGDPYLKIFDVNNNLIAFNDDGANNLNSRINITLNSGQTYRIRVSTYSYKSGSLNFIVRKNGDIQEAQGTNLNSLSTTVSNDAIWYEFTAKTNDYYTFYTTGTADSYLTLYDASYNQLSFNDDGGTNRNAQIDMYLFKGKKYYIKASTFGMQSGNFNLHVNRQETIKIDELYTFSEVYYNSSGGFPEFYRFIPAQTKNYVIETYRYEGDPVLSIYDENMILIANNDDGAGNSNARLSLQLTAGKIYYFRVRSFGSSADGYGYVRLLE